MSRPIITKKITRNNIVYNLELWNPANVSMTDELSDQPSFRKEFFNDISMDGSWPGGNQDKYKERFDDWFDNLDKSKQRAYAKAIDESNRMIITMVWDIIHALDKSELFNNNIRQFSNWFATLDPSDIDFYMTRVMRKKRLIPSKLSSPISSESLTEQEVTDLLSQVYDTIDDDLIRATSINGLLCISCTDETRLQKAKKHMVRHGSILRDYRKKENANGRVIYTYIFSKP